MTWGYLQWVRQTKSLTNSDITDVFSYQPTKSPPPPTRIQTRLLFWLIYNYHYFPGAVFTQLHSTKFVVCQTHIITHFGSDVALSSHRSILSEIPPVCKTNWENDLRIALMGLTNLKFDRLRHYWCFQQISQQTLLLFWLIYHYRYYPGTVFTPLHGTKF
jgi:hypothetical protein